MNIKKIIASVAFALGAWMSVGVAQAQTTNYNFAESFYIDAGGDPGYSGPNYLGSFSATFIGDGSANPTMYAPTSARFGMASSLNFMDATYAYTSSTDVLGSLQGNLGSKNSGNYAVIAFPQVGIPGYPSSQSFSFVYNGNTFNVLGTTPVASTYGPGSQTFYASSMSVSQVGGAPEIDGSLAPKVGFLLGCLFLMFGRKRQNTEPMMTA